MTMAKKGYRIQNKQSSSCEYLVLTTARWNCTTYVAVESAVSLLRRVCMNP